MKDYLKQLEEIKERLAYISKYSNESMDRFVIESHALQIRKLVELLSFSLMAIHKATYKAYRYDAGKNFKYDWNGKNIINSILSLNPDIFFKASEKGFVLQSNGEKQIQLKPEDQYFSLKRLAKLYDRCGGVLHVENPWNKSTRTEQFHAELPSIILKLNNTLQNNVVFMNHWEMRESTVIVFTLNEENLKPIYALALAPGNFSIE